MSATVVLLATTLKLKEPVARIIELCAISYSVIVSVTSVVALALLQKHPIKIIIANKEEHIFRIMSHPLLFTN